MHRNPTPNTWMHQNRHPSGKCTGILPLTHECSKIIIPQVNAPYPSNTLHTFHTWMHWNHHPSSKCTRTPHTWMHRNRQSSGQCTENLPLTHECTEIILPQVNAPEYYPSHMNALKSSSLEYMHQNFTPHTWMHRNHHSFHDYTEFLPLTHECTEIILPHVNAPESYPSHINSPKSSSLK